MVRAQAACSGGFVGRLVCACIWNECANKCERANEKQKPVMIVTQHWETLLFDLYAIAEKQCVRVWVLLYISFCQGWGWMPFIHFLKGGKATLKQPLRWYIDLPSSIGDEIFADNVWNDLPKVFWAWSSASKYWQSVTKECGLCLIYSS